jgi:hypothetical protein
VMTNTPSPTVSVYSGRVCLGRVLRRGRAGFEAFDIDQKSLGTFLTQREAVAAVPDHTVGTTGAHSLWVDWPPHCCSASSACASPIGACKHPATCCCSSREIER